MREDSPVLTDGGGLKRQGADVSKTKYRPTPYEELLAACRLARSALCDLSRHPAFAGGDPPEFNVGGVGYEANTALEVAIARATG